MPRKKKWTEERIKDEILPLIDAKWSVAAIAKEAGISRQRLYKVIKDYRSSVSE